MHTLCVIAHNLRSAHNVGSLLRTAEGLGVEKVYLTGYTPYPTSDSDSRLPHESRKLHKQITKTALGAETSLSWEHADAIEAVINALRVDGYSIVALEQAPGATLLPSYVVPEKLALIIGREVEGIEPAILAGVDDIVEIPMFGDKESFNVIQAAAMALYHCKFN